MLNNKHIGRCVILACNLAVAVGCDNGGGSGGSEQAQPLPTDFTDVHDVLWTCPRSTAEAELRGEAVLNADRAIRRADILHLSLVAELNNEMQLISAKCINNLSHSDVSFTLPYDPTAIQPEARYFLYTNYFSPTEDERYQLTLTPDGITEVLREGEEDTLRVILNPL